MSVLIGVCSECLFGLSADKRFIRERDGAFASVQLRVVQAHDEASQKGRGTRKLAGQARRERQEGQEGVITHAGRVG